jgi:hypothetical protein
VSPRELVRSHVRVRVAWATGTGVQAEGVVIGYLDQPSLLIRQDDGSHVHVAVSCPLTVLGPETAEDPAPPSG